MDILSEPTAETAIAAQNHPDLSVSRIIINSNFTSSINIERHSNKLRIATIMYMRVSYIYIYMKQLMNIF